VLLPPVLIWTTSGEEEEEGVPKAFCAPSLMTEMPQARKSTAGKRSREYFRKVR
jgi:hypothetical protein